MSQGDNRHNPSSTRMTASLDDLLRTLPQTGQVAWIGLRPGRRQPVRVVDAVEAAVGQGLVGDRAQGGPREVTLIQAEHLVVIASLLQRVSIDPALLRRNLVIGGINLSALKDRQCQIGKAVLEFTGPAHPCSRMEEALGPGGFNAVRGHGGITARVLVSGRIQVGDVVVALPSNPNALAATSKEDL